MARKIYINNIKTIFTSLGDNTAEFYDKHTFLTMVGIFWPEFGLKPSYFALHLTENGIFF